MAEPIDYIERTREQYAALGYPPYRWVVNDDVPPFTPLSRPLAESRVALVASGGVYRVGQTAFHFKDDLSFRAIGKDTPKEALRISHFAYDTTDARTDVNVVFPYQTLSDLARLGRVGRLADIAASYQQAVFDALLLRIRRGLERTNVGAFALVGGVARNRVLRRAIDELMEERSVRLMLAPMEYCTDNAAMIAGLAGYPGDLDWHDDRRYHCSLVV